MFAYVIVVPQIPRAASPLQRMPMYTGRCDFYLENLQTKTTF